jgi:hypothetical protein
VAKSGWWIAPRYGIVANEDVAVADAGIRVREPLRALHDERQHIALRHDVWADGNERPVGHHDRGRGIVAGDEDVRPRAAHVLDAHLLGDGQ